jgi:hypothetical protein
MTDGKVLPCYGYMFMREGREDGVSGDIFSGIDFSHMNEIRNRPDPVAEEVSLSELGFVAGSCYNSCFFCNSHGNRDVIRDIIMRDNAHREIRKKVYEKSKIFEGDERVGSNC